MTTTIITGKMGSGKTLLATMMHYNSNVPIHSNFPIKSEMYRPLTISELLEPSGAGVVILDEAYLYIESRTSGKGTNRLWSRILFQSRKDDRDIVIIAQLLSSVDLRFRSMAEYIILCQREPTALKAPLKGFKYTLLERTNFGFRKKTVRVPVDIAQQYFGLYDTNFKVDEMDNELIASNADSTELYPIVDREVQNIIKTTNPRSITQAFCNDYAREKGLTKTHAKMIYERIKRLTTR